MNGQHRGSGWDYVPCLKVQNSKFVRCEEHVFYPNDASKYLLLFTELIGTKEPPDITGVVALLER